MQLATLNFQQKFEFEFKNNKDTFFIYDVLRKNYLKLTPEEWVRQHWIRYFIEIKGYSASALISEKKIELNGTTKRIDLLVTEKTIPQIIIECKAPSVAITQKTFEQIARYNSVIKAKNIILSNGIHHVFAELSENGYVFKKENLYSI